MSAVLANGMRVYTFKVPNPESSTPSSIAGDSCEQGPQFAT